MTAKSTKKAPARGQKKVRVGAGTSRRSTWRQTTRRNRISLIFTVVAVALLGTYFLIHSYASPSPRAEDVARGLIFDNLTPVAHGACADSFQDSHPYVPPNSNIPGCTHIDPGPPGVDVRVRDKQVDALLAAQLDYDTKHPAKSAGDTNQPTPILTADDVGSAGSLSSVTPNYQPCSNAGATDTYAYRLLYVYKAGTTNRFDSIHDALGTVARRVNAVMYQSSLQNNGDPRQVRFMTNADCTFSWGVNAISGDINDFGNIKRQLIAQGRTSVYHKFLVWVDGGSGCGVSDVMMDSKPTQDNSSNYGGTFSVVWHPCWNYAEPHELMHSLGAVQHDSPHATAGFHCWDEHDVMCYDDNTSGSGKLSVVCGSSVSIWRYDCGDNDYFNSNLPVASGYLSSHWNTANSRFLTRY